MQEHHEQYPVLCVALQLVLYRKRGRLEFLQKGRTMQASDWIPCSERMPGLVMTDVDYISSVLVLVWTTHHKWQRGRFLAAKDGRQWWYLGGYAAPLDEITHWMPVVGPEVQDAH